MQNNYSYINRHAKLLKAISYLGGKCQECGETYFLYLDFHHRDNKKDNVRNLLNGKWTTIRNELDQCILLCCKCHRLKHFDNVRYNSNKEKILCRIEQIQNMGNNGNPDNFVKHKNEIIKELQKGTSFSKIHKTTGVCKKTIRELATSININRSNIKNEIPIDENKFIELYNDRIKISDIANYFNCSVYPIFRLRKKLIHEGAISKYHKRIIEKNELEKCLKDGLSAKEIAEKFNMKPDSIRKRIQKLNNV